MADLSSLSGLSFSADDYSSFTAGGFGTPDFSQFATTGTVTVTGLGDGSFSNADAAANSGQDPISATVASVDTSDATSYRLGTVVVNEIQDNAIYDTYTADIIAINNGQVLLGVGTYDPTDPTDPYNGTYALLSDTSVSVAASNTTYSTTVSNTDPNAYSPPCFAAGTMILTPQGETAVEALRVGDVVVTLSGVHERVIWVGSRFVDIARHPQPETVRPIRIRADAFDQGAPSRDLFVSPDHAIHVDGVLIPAKYLVNGSSVTVSGQASVTYHHIELDRHEVVFANALPAETYLDTGNRISFNGRRDTVFVPHPDFSTASDLVFFTWDAQGYAELVLTGPKLDAVRARLGARAAGAGHDVDRAAA